MDGSHFDTLTRAFVELRSRRGLGHLLGGLVVAGSLPRLGSPETMAKGKKGKKKAKRQPPVTPPPAPPCQGQPDNTPCNGTGRCLLGSCNPRPTCTVGGAGSCPLPPNPPCCGTCTGAFFGSCLLSGPGQSCYESADCAAGLRCVGYVCQIKTCAAGENVCEDFGAVCGPGDTGGCLRPVDGGPSRCGTFTSTCGCTSHQECAGLGAGAFCAQTPAASLCACSTTTNTRCALPA